MFLDDRKKETELELVQALMNMSKSFFNNDLDRIIVCNINRDNSISGEFIVIFSDGTFADHNDMYIFSYLSRKALTELTLEFASISDKAIDCKSIDPHKPTNITLLDLKRDGKYVCNYYENLPEYKYARTPIYVWKYKKVGVNDQDCGIREAAKFISKYNIVPERILKPRVNIVPLKDLVENLLLKFIYYLYNDLPETTSKIYFHLDSICGKEKYSLYIKTSDLTIKLNNFIEVDESNCELLTICNNWLDDFDTMHEFCNRKKYTSIDFVYNLDNGELNYSYDNVTEDNFDDEQALIKSWEEEYFSKNPIKKFLNKINKKQESLLTGTMIIDESKFMYDYDVSDEYDEDEEEEDNMTVVAEKFEGNDIHELVPLYLQRGYEIINAILPDDWTKFYFYTEDDGTISRQLGYIIVDDEYVSLQELPRYETCSPELYAATMEQLKLWSNYFRTAFADHKMQPWTVFSYSLDREGNISTDFEYIDLSEQKYSNEFFDLWSYKHLGIKDNIPEDIDLKDITPANVYTKLK